MADNPEPQWTWDPVLQKYWYFDQQRQAYVYPDGSWVSTDGQSPAPRIVPEVNQQQIHYTDGRGNDTLNEQRGYQPGFTRIPSNYEATSNAQPETHPSYNSGMASSSHQPYTSTQTYGQRLLQAGYRQNLSSVTPTQSVAGPPAPDSLNLGNVSAYGNDLNITTQQLAKLQLLETVDDQRVKKSMQKSSSNLDPKFKGHQKPKEFFIVGRVFRAPWPETARKTGSTNTEENKQFGIRIHTTIKWFVVVQPYELHCLCLPITTFGGRGVSSRRQLHQYSIIDTGRDKPKPLKTEEPEDGQSGMQPWIRVEPAHKSIKMQPMSRLCYVKAYTVEHYLKVDEVGMVHKSYIERLVKQWCSYVNAVAQASVIPEVQDSHFDEEETAGESWGFQNSEETELLPEYDNLPEHEEASYTERQAEGEEDQQNLANDESPPKKKKGRKKDKGKGKMYKH